MELVLDSVIRREDGEELQARDFEEIEDRELDELIERHFEELEERAPGILQFMKDGMCVFLSSSLLPTQKLKPLLSFRQHVKKVAHPHPASSDGSNATDIQDREFDDLEERDLDLDLDIVEREFEDEDVFEREFEEDDLFERDLLDEDDMFERDFEEEFQEREIDELD